MTPAADQPAAHAPADQPVAPEYGDRFPGYDVLSQREHWDAVTREVVESRLSPPTGPNAFDEHESAVVCLLVAILLDLDAEMAKLFTAQIGSRLALGETDGWHYADMPEDVEVFRRSVTALDHEAWLRTGEGFLAVDRHTRYRIVSGVQSASGAWGGLPAGQLWSLWLRYACTAYYGQPAAWNEIGFGGPAYPRGYKNSNIDGREPFEVKDAGPVIHLTGTRQMRGQS